MKLLLKKLLPKSLKKKIKNKIVKYVKNDLKNTECIYKLDITEIGKLYDKVAIITGGSGAIGSSICFRLAMQGATVVIIGRKKDKLNFIADQIKKNNGKVEIIEMDVSNSKEVERNINLVYKKYGHIDILVNNAGGSAREKMKVLIEQEIDTIDSVLNSNLRGSIICSKYVAQYMINNENGGKIINISSTTGIQGNSGNVDYSAAKSGIIGLTKALAKELGKYNINVNCISPGRINQIIFDKPLESIKDDGCYLNRIGKTDDIAGVVQFLVSDDASFITGQNIVVDGGRSLGLKGE